MRMPAIVTAPPVTATDGQEHIPGFPPITLSILDDHGRWQYATDPFTVAMSVGEVPSAPRPGSTLSVIAGYSPIE